MPAGGGAGGLDGFSKPADTSWAQWYELQNIFNVGRLGISLGIPRISIQIPRINIPQLVPKITIPQTPVVFTSPTRGPELHVSEDVQMPPITRPLTKTEILRQAQKRLLGIPLGPTGRAQASPLWDWVRNAPKPGVIAVANTPAIVPKVQPPIQMPSINTGATKTTGASPMDLGDLLGQLGSAFIQAKYSPPVVTPAAISPSMGFPEYQGGSALPGTATRTVGVVDEAREAICGPRRRRRRKRLATASDIRDLAALKDTIGPSMTKTWIATHS